MARTKKKVRDQERERLTVRATSAEAAVIKAFLSLSEQQQKSPDLNNIPCLWLKQEKQEISEVFDIPFATVINGKRQQQQQQQQLAKTQSFYKPKQRKNIVLSLPPTVITPNTADSLISTFYPKLWQQPRL